MRAAYPVMLDVTDCPILIVGGGAVAARKAAGLVEAGARAVRVVAPEFLVQMPAGIDRRQTRYDAVQLEGVRLAFAATNAPKINEQIVADARARGIWASRADDADAGDFATLAKRTSGPLTIAVSAGSAALSATVRDELIAALHPGWIRLADAMALLRPRVVASGLPEAMRRSILRDAATPEARDAVSTGGPEALLRWLADRHPALPQLRTFPSPPGRG